MSKNPPKRPKRREEEDNVPHISDRSPSRVKELLDENHKLLQDLARTRKLVRKLMRQNEELTVKNYTKDLKISSLLKDSLTGIFNRAGLDLAFEETLTKGRGAVFLIDLDKFKSINDTYGHAAGDAALKLVADTLKSIIRSDESIIAFIPAALPGYEQKETDNDPSGLLARYGGDEFLVIIDGASEKQAKKILQRMNKAFSELFLRWNEHSIPVQASIGMTTFTRDQSFEDIKATADKAMYAQKQARRP